MTIFPEMQLSRWMPLLLPAATALALLPACTNIKNDRTRTKVEGTTAGAATGGVLGGLIGGVVGLGSPDSIARGALMGAQIGGGAGYSYGEYITNKKAQYASTEAWLDACIAEVRRQTKKSHDYNRLARQVISRQERELAALKKSGRTSVAAQPQAAVLNAQVNQSLTNLDKALRYWELTVEAHRSVVARTRASAQTETLRAEVDNLETERQALEQDRAQFTELKAQLSP